MHVSHCNLHQRSRSCNSRVSTEMPRWRALTGGVGTKSELIYSSIQQSSSAACCATGACTVGESACAASCTTTDELGPDIELGCRGSTGGESDVAGRVSIDKGGSEEGEGGEEEGN